MDMKKIGLCLILFLMTAHRVWAIDRIGVRQVNNIGEFYNTVTNEKFVLRGNNTYIDIFNYNPTDLKSMFDEFRVYGYNSIRIFVSFDWLGNESGGLLNAYMEGMANVLKEAEKRNIYVLIVLDALPSKGGYYPSGAPIPVWDATNMVIHDQNINKYYMDQAFIDAKKKYVSDFINALKSKNVPLEVVLGYEIGNESLFALDQEPLSLTSGMVTTATGSYDMGDAGQRQHLMDISLINWSTKVREAIKTADPQALAGFCPYGPYGIPKYAPHGAMDTYWMFADPDKGGSTVDFVDLHVYPFAGAMEPQMAAYRISSHKKPIVLGEFGADTGDYATAADGAAKLKAWQVESCKYSFAGWWTWIWDFGATGFHSVVESDGTIKKALAPIYRSNPCQSSNTTTATGYLESVSCTSLAGWAGKVETTSPLKVHLYADRTTFLGEVSANQSREQAVCKVLNTNEPSCNHGFSFNVPDSLKDGKSHTINAYAIENWIWPMAGSGKTINCAGHKAGDFNNDNQVNNQDLDIIKANFGSYTIFDYNTVVENFNT